MSEAAVGQAVKHAESPLATRHRYAETGRHHRGTLQIHRSDRARRFRTVLLMEDTVVDERLILKVPEPERVRDEEVMKRFVHELALLAQDHAQERHPHL